MKELKAHRLKREIDTLYNELRKHQNKCKHKKAVKKHGSNTGNYDPSADCYWTDFYCPTCLKKWRKYCS
jgi:hypothetical protein